MSTILTQSLESLRGVGPKLAERLRDYGVGNVEDLLFHLPLRYQDRTQITPIAALQDGAEVVIEGEIALVNVVGAGRRRSLVVKLRDTTGIATLRFFHFSRAQQNALTPGETLRCFGVVRRAHNSQPDMIHPEYRRGNWQADDESALTPVYPTTEGLSQGQWRKLTQQALKLLRDAPPREQLTRDGGGFALSYAHALHHRPPPPARPQPPQPTDLFIFSGFHLEKFH